MHPPIHAVRAWRALAARSTAVAALCVGITLDACAASTAPDIRCADGVCVTNLDEKDSLDPCTGATMTLAWRQAGGAVLIQCQTSDADMDKPSFVYNRDAPTAPAFPLTGMRFFKSNALGGLASDGVPDKFASHAFCKPPRPPRMAAGEILIGEKVPTGKDDNPYCYRVLRIATTAGGVAIHADDNDAPKPEAAHADWDKLAAKMTALIRASSSATAAAALPTVVATTTADTRLEVLHVVHAKAALFDSVGNGEAAHGYLVQGDEVSVLDRSRLADGWLKVRYVGKSGKPIERWLDAADVGVKATAAASH